MEIVTSLRAKLFCRENEAQRSACRYAKSYGTPPPGKIINDRFGA